MFLVLPGSPVVKTPYRVCVCVCMCFQSLVETWRTRETRILHAMWHSKKKKKFPSFPGNSLVVQWLEHCAFIAMGLGLVQLGN